jgi:molybdate transport system substrate-binding protein
MHTKILAIILLSTFLHASSITVALAANVSYAIVALKTAFENHYPTIHVKTIISGSGKLTAQIKRGAPYDLFLSANMLYPHKLYKEHFAIHEPAIYAQGSLAILSKQSQDFTNLTSLLQSKKIQLIAIANPRLAPYGKAALQTLHNLHLYHKIKNKLIFGESIAQTLTYTMTAANLGFIAKSALYSARMQHFKEGKNYKEINPQLYTPIAQGIVILSRAKHNQDAYKFYNFMLSQEAKTILQNYGYNIL